MTIEILDHHVVYENPHPHNRARHGFFPGLVTLPSGETITFPDSESARQFQLYVKNLKELNHIEKEVSTLLKKHSLKASIQTRYKMKKKVKCSSFYFVQLYKLNINTK